MPSVKNPTALPIHHPDYRYAPSRNPYSEKIKQGPGIVFSDNQTESFKGNWKKKPSEKLHVEIGCNAGHVVVEWAARNLEHRYIGIDWKFKAIYRAFEKAFKRKLENIHFLRAHADRIGFMFAPGEVDHLYLFFPDPWAKKSQLKNRFINEAKLRTIHELLAPGGTFQIKTDHPGYFSWMEEQIAKTSNLWKVTFRSTDLHAGNPEAGSLNFPEVTCFEKLFIKDGLPIMRIDLQKI
ncbi:methyltransferase domain-containing protein [bacterium]|nr:methyltransferase domain-containing protein [bacterium]